MDGYSVQDAATVLGVAEGRVWELLARGVLAGTPEGDSMRVYLKAQAAPVAAAPRDDAPRPNGNGGAHPPAVEASAFRELLTEFRNLTERYGQALLALGEARGEVAGLRSRLELLEARLDLRLPGGDQAPVAWAASPTQAVHEAAPRIATPDEPIASGRTEGEALPPSRERKPRRQRSAKSPRSAVAGFADALARAQDPSTAEVVEAMPAPEEAVAAASANAGDAFVAPQFEAIAIEPISPADELATEDETEQAEPKRELRPAEVIDASDVESVEDREDVGEAGPAEKPALAPPMTATRSDQPAAPVAQPGYSPADVEPDWFADGDFGWLEAAELEAAEREKEAQAIVAPEPAEPEAGVATPPVAEPVAEPVAAAPIALEAAPVADTIAAIEVRGGEEEAVLWIGDPVVPEPAVDESTPAPVAQPASEPSGERSAEPTAPSPAAGATTVAVASDAPRAIAWPASDRRPSAAPPPPPPLAMTEEELAMLAQSEGWDEAEVAAIRAMIARPVNRFSPLPGSAELDEAMAALQAVPVQPDPALPPRSWAKSAAPRVPERDDEWAYQVEPPPARPGQATFPGQPTLPGRPASDPDWLRQRRGPAAAAYRRLRRLFPG